jgi:hypothetical protein
MSSHVPATPDPDLWLSTQVQLKHYLVMETTRDIPGLAKFIYKRFSERYFEPLKNVRAGDDSGFLTMGVCCLLIEGLTAFREGWPSTKGKSKDAFRLFFARESRFAAFHGLEDNFWLGIRCGILHQGETSKGWRLNFTRPDEALFEPLLKRINCARFFKALEEILSECRDELLRSSWDDPIWINLRTKMEQTIKDCVA